MKCIINSKIHFSVCSAIWTNGRLLNWCEASKLSSTKTPLLKHYLPFHSDAQIAKSQSQRFEIAIASRTLSSQGATQVAARIASKSVETEAGSAKLSTTTARAQSRALGPQVYGRYPNPGKHRKIISTIAFARLAKIWSSAVVVDSSVLLRKAKPGGFQTRVFPTFFGKGPDCVADPFGTVPRGCS